MAMAVVGDAQIAMDGDFESSLRDEIMERCMFLLSLVGGTIPMNRDLGMDPDITSCPPHIAQQRYTISAIELIDEYEPRVCVEEVQFETSGEDGYITPKVVLTYNDE